MNSERVPRCECHTTPCRSWCPHKPYEDSMYEQRVASRVDSKWCRCARQPITGAKCRRCGGFVKGRS